MARWSFSDSIAAVEAYARGGLPAATAAFPQRGRGVVRGYLVHNGWHRSQRPHVEWSGREIALLKRLWAEGATFKAMAKALGRTQPSIDAQAVRLKLPRREAPEWRGQRRVMDRAVDAMVADTATKLGRTPNAVSNCAVRVLLAQRRGERYGAPRGLRQNGKRLWTEPEVRFVEHVLDTLVRHLGRTIPRSHDTLHNALVRSLCSNARRRKAATIRDLGGMAQLGSATRPGRAA